ncbi:MAG: MFS transporter [Akkermansiaceae bacterium]|nr:MFS transporter [Verrucomicrobiales bacterium]
MEDPEISVEASIAPKGKKNSYEVLRNRDFLIYLVGRFFASIGQQMLVFTVFWELYERTHSAFSLALVGLAFMVPMVGCTLPAGHVADNFNRKRIILTMCLVLSVGSLGLALVSALNAPVGWVYCCLVVIGAARTFMWPASAAFLPHIVPRSMFAQAVAFNSGTFQLSSVAGPAVAGVLVAWLGHRMAHPAAVIYAINAGAALICFGMVMLIRSEHTVKNRQPMSFNNLGEGFKFVFQNKIILGTISLDMFAVLLGGATGLLPIIAKDILNSTPSGLGWLRTAMPIGAVICTVIIAHRPPMKNAGKAMLWSVAIFGLATIGFGLSRWYWVSFAALLICGAVDNISVIVRQTLVQLLTPDDKRGRVSAVNSLFIGTSNELGEFESGMVAGLFGVAMGNTEAFGSVVSVVSGGIGTILVVIAVAIIWPEVRKYGRLDSGMEKAG